MLVCALSSVQYNASIIVLTLYLCLVAVFSNLYPLYSERMVRERSGRDREADRQALPPGGRDGTSSDGSRARPQPDDGNRRRDREPERLVLLFARFLLSSSVFLHVTPIYPI